MEVLNERKKERTREGDTPHVRSFLNPLIPSACYAGYRKKENWPAKCQESYYLFIKCDR